MKSVYLDEKAKQFYEQAIIYREKADVSIWPISFFYKSTAKSLESNANIMEATRISREETSYLEKEIALLEIENSKRKKVLKERFDKFMADYELFKVQVSLNPNAQELLDKKVIDNIDTYIKQVRL